MSVTRSGIGMKVSTASISSSTVFSHCASPLRAPKAETRTTGKSSPGNCILAQEFAHFELDQIEQFRIVHHVHFVHRDHDVGHTDLTGQQDMLACLGHGAVGGGDDEDRSIHLGRARDHVLDVIGVTGAIDVRVVPVFGLVLHMRGRDRDAARFFFRRIIDRIERTEGHLRIVLRQHLRDGRRQGCLAVIDMPDRPDIDVRFAAVEFFFTHGEKSSPRI